MQNNRKAFSLIEAMVILLLISVAVMALIPLMTKSSSNPRWRLINETLAFGTIAKHNVKISTGSTADTTPDARLKVLGSASFIQTGATGSNNILITDNYDASATEPYTPLTNGANSSIILGVNTCSAIPDSSIIVGSFDAATACSGDAIDIGNDNTNINVNSDGNLILKANGIAVLTLNHDNSFEIKYPDNNMQGFTYNDGELEIHNGFSVSDGTGTLYLNSYTTIAPDEFNCTIDGQTGLTVNSYSDAEAKINAGYTCTIVNDSTKYTYNTISGLKSAPDYCNEIIKNDTSNSPTHSYCHNTKDNWWEFKKTNTTSDKRLKNIIADYEKGLENLNKIKTYNFTYKADKQKRNHVGLIAQHLQNLYDEALHKDEKGYLSYEKEPILYSMINAVKEIFAKQNKMEKQTRKLNKKADKLIRMYR